MLFSPDPANLFDDYELELWADRLFKGAQAMLDKEDHIKFAPRYLIRVDYIEKEGTLCLQESWNNHEELELIIRDFKDDIMEIKLK